MWRNLRIAILLLILGIAAWSNWYDRLSTTDWDETLYVGVFPVAAADDVATRDYIAQLSSEDIVDIERFLNREARRYEVAIARPVSVELYPEVAQKPPERATNDNMLQTMWWSLKLRMYARRAARASGRPPPQIRVFVLYHDPSFTRAVPHSVGLQKGLVGVVHAFAARHMAATNNVVIAHEILHTLGASDKYDAQSLAPLYPSGYAEPDLEPLYPQTYTEIMAGRFAIDASTFEMPEALDDVRVGPASALEIGWTRR
jgi:ribosomal protein L31E